MCRACVADGCLWQQVAEGLRRRTCIGCGKRRLAVLVEDLAAVIDSVFRLHFEPGGQDSYGGPRGDTPTFLLQELAGIDVDVAEAIVEILAEEERYDVAHDGTVAYYDEGGGYVGTPLYTHEHFYQWAQFEERLKHRSRFFDPQASHDLADMLTDLPDKWMQISDGPVLTLPAGTLVYRARRVTTEHQASVLCAEPGKELGPPPREKRLGGRLNAAGIAVFYGGLSPDVCVAETRPPVGSLVVVGEFETLEPLRVFDLTAFDRHSPSGSLFCPGFEDELSRWRFLQTFHQLVSQPVHPQQEFIDYVPTQVVAEYLANVSEYAGLVYRSAQVGRALLDDEEWGLEDDTDPTLRSLSTPVRHSWESIREQSPVS